MTGKVQVQVQVAVGDTVIVRSGNHRSHMQTDRYTVTGVARVWITLRPEGMEESGAIGWDRRFRLDNQTDGSSYGTPAHFYTLEQWAARERELAGSAFLCEQGVWVEVGSPWHRRHADLADIIREAIEPPMPEGPLGGAIPWDGAA